MKFWHWICKDKKKISHGGLELLVEQMKLCYWKFIRWVAFFRNKCGKIIVTSKDGLRIFFPKNIFSLQLLKYIFYFLSKIPGVLQYGIGRLLLIMIGNNWGCQIILMTKLTKEGAIQKLYLTPWEINFILVDRVFLHKLLKKSKL